MSFDLLLTDEAICLDKHPQDAEAKVVSCTSVEAAFQLAGKGTPISAEDAARFGVKTTKAEATNYTLRLDSHTIARTPEEKAYAATQAQPGLVMAQAEQIRQSAALSVAALGTAAAAKNADAAAAAKKEDEKADAKVKASLEKAPRKTSAKSTRKTTARKTTKTPEAAKTEIVTP